MDRRNFFKLVGTASGGVVTGACGRSSREIIPLLVPEREIVPGVEEWHPSVCRECAAGCGVIVRVMEAERTIETKGGKVRERIAAIKKIEGNPLDPVSGGRLCARGQAAVQSLYHPDRLREPMKRSGNKGEARFTPVSWQEAIEQTSGFLKKADATRIAWLAHPQTGSRSATVASFLSSIGAPPPITIGAGDFAVERKAAELAFGWNGLPVYDIQNADFVLSIGADFLGGWISPVFYSRRFGHMRQGKPGRRGRLIHAESRFSTTAGAADEWLPVRPGGEQALALAIGHILAAEKLTRQEAGAARVRDWFASVDLERMAKAAGLSTARIREVAQSLGRAESPVVLAGATIVQSNSLDAVVTAHMLNRVLGSVSRPGGILPPPEVPDPKYLESQPRSDDVLARLASAQLVFLDGVDPAYTLAGAAGMLAKAPVVSFSPFIDDSSAYADVILPDHSWLESESMVVPPASPGPALTGAPAFVRPLHNTRRTEDVLVELAKGSGKTIEPDAQAGAFERLYTVRKPPGDWTAPPDFAAFCERQGGWWADAESVPPAAAVPSLPASNEAEFSGDAAAFPLHFQPYPSIQFGDGRGANLPWLQELPDPSSSAMWGLPVEVDPGTARALSLANGDIVRVVSPQGQVEAPVYVHPAALPGVVSMAIGQGHTDYTRYASGRGANPLSIAAPAVAKGTGAFAFGATRVRLEKTGRRGGLIQFSATDRAPEIKRT
jgi:anaerobic selenocysteine-containing dehydrogenase